MTVRVAIQKQGSQRRAQPTTKRPTASHTSLFLWLNKSIVLARRTRNEKKPLS